MSSPRQTQSMGVVPLEELRPDALTAPDGQPVLPEGARKPGGIKAFLHKHHRKLWWLHSLYAMGLGAFVVTFAQKGFRHARWLTLTLLATWILIVLVFRLAGSGAEQQLDTPKKKLRFLMMTYVLKNLYQGMLFFLLPFYWKTATLSAGNKWFMFLLTACTLLATLDVIFDRYLMRWRSLASVYYMVTLFAVSNVAIPAVWPMPALWSLMLAALFSTLGFWTLHFSLRELIHHRQRLIALSVSVVAMLCFAYGARRLIPPVPLSVAQAAVGPEVLPDGRLALEVTSLHKSMMNQMKAVTDVLTPAGEGEVFTHVWRHQDREVLRLQPKVKTLDRGHRLRLSSELRREQLPKERAGDWTVDVETAHGQLVGRFTFEVTD